MKNDPFYLHLREEAWRRTLTPAEQQHLRSWLAAHPETQPDWETEAMLNDMLGRLPEAPVPSNFTARVLQAIEHEERSLARVTSRGWHPWFLRGWLPKTAFAAFAVSLGLLSYQQARSARRARLAQSVVAVADVSSLPSPEILTNFDAVYSLNQSPGADETLLALMQ